jgi:multiple sugar transport system substrate-binding protein
MTPQLRGMAWDHVRGVAPMRTATEEFRHIRPDVTISWEARSLKDFEDYPIEPLAENYDLILMDHPFVGVGAEKSVLVPLDEWLPAEYMDDQKDNSVGPSYDSYTWEGHQWALAVDAAAQVSACRADLLDKVDAPVPEDWNDVLGLIEALPDGIDVGMTLNPTHAYCCFLALCVTIGGSGFWDESGIDSEVGRESLGFLRRLVPMVHPRSLELSPIGLLNLMSSTDEVGYVPLTFGYSNYSREGFATHLVRFIDIPRTAGEPAGGILGGVGLAVSSSSEYRQEAVEFAANAASREFQTGLYVQSGGQPGHRAAWTDPHANELTNGFFEGTLRTLDHAYMRPRRPGYNSFQERAGDVIHNHVRNGGDAVEDVRTLTQLYQETVNIS